MQKKNSEIANVRLNAIERNKCIVKKNNVVRPKY